MSQLLSQIGIRPEYFSYKETVYDLQYLYVQLLNQKTIIVRFLRPRIVDTVLALYARLSHGGLPFSAAPACFCACVNHDYIFCRVELGSFTLDVFDP